MTQQRKDHPFADHYPKILWGSWKKLVPLNGIRWWCNLEMRDKELWTRGRSIFTLGHGWLWYLTLSHKKWLAHFISGDLPWFLPALSLPTARVHFKTLLGMYHLYDNKSLSDLIPFHILFGRNFYVLLFLHKICLNEERMKLDVSMWINTKEKNISPQNHPTA